MTSLRISKYPNGKSGIARTHNDEGLFSTNFDPVENNVVKATGEFEGKEGTASLDGEVDLSGFFDKGVVTFNCVFTIDLKSYE